ncbi:sensor histidine kinase [Gynuella sunshinyii]|uniref:histidine kinase n=1 Tax=Gynuella sunshinyii YC6258 TaxID=1445510 RepID=A0A0C5VKA4_9GAMM|nr:sensor histidine kinase [Gynuella sunshinyii]AJQ93803.1 signal transduction histidine kinase [Gynuella sunshinyii YC6258]
MYSLKRNLHFNLLLTISLPLIILISVLAYSFEKFILNYIESRLLHDADTIITALSLDDQQHWQLNSNALSDLYLRVNSGHYFVVKADDQTFRSRSLFDLDIAPSWQKNRCQEIDEQWYACMVSLTKSDRPVNIWVAEDIRPIEQSQREIVLLVIAISTFTMMLLAYLQYRVLERGFSKLDTIRQMISSIHMGESKPDSQKLPIEIQPLMDEIERLLAQLEQRIQRSRNAVGNVAHELKRPLQRFRSLLEHLPTDQETEGERILSEFHHIIERELKRARIAGMATPGRYAVLNEDIEQLIKIFNTLYPDVKSSVSYPQQLVIPQDRDDILELLGNLLDNASKFARSHIYLSITITPQGWIIVIEDDGKGVSESDLQMITNRGVRLDESISGHGLGLSMCHDIVNGYSGKMTFSVSSYGGLKVEVFMPLSDA